MKHKIQMVVGASASALVLSTLAQVAPDIKTAQTDSPDHTNVPLHHAQRTDRLNDAAKTSDLIGMTVKNYQNEKLGKVEDLALDVESGRVVQVILSTGGFLGIGDKLTAVPPEALQHDVAQKVLHLDADKEKLKDAPQFEMSNWADYSDTNHLGEVYRRYGQETALTFIQPGTGEKESLSSESQSGMIPASRLGQVQKASKVMGVAVINLQNEKVGKVEDILIDLAAGRVVAVVVSSGGFLGLGDELSAVPPTALRFTPDRETLQLDASKEQLSNAPHFKADQWPEFGQASYASGVYQAYKVAPYFSTNTTATLDHNVAEVREGKDTAVTTTEPDNSARNVRDRSNDSLTPFEQGNDKSDVATTAQIRKEIVADKTMSVNAKNVKIITNKGRVTLRGPVQTAEEKRLIGDIAVRVAQAENVDNQLEVK